MMEGRVAGSFFAYSVLLVATADVWEERDTVLVTAVLWY